MNPRNGKWRRQIVVPAVAGCVDTPLTDPNVTRLPRNTTEGDIPLIAITTGGADSMECLPRRMRLENSVFSTEAGQGRIHLYSGHDVGDGDDKSIPSKAFTPALGGATMTQATQLWDDVASLSKYDIVILSCEGGTVEEEKPMSAREAMYDYASAGGRVFASHRHRIWEAVAFMLFDSSSCIQNDKDPPAPRSSAELERRPGMSNN